MKKTIIIVLAIILAVVTAFISLTCLERVAPGNVGVVYSTKGVEDEVLTQGWEWVGLFEHVKQFPISQQQIVFSNNPADYNEDKHQDWHIDAPANGGMVAINVVVNYNFIPDRVVDIYKKFNGMDGDAIVENRVANSIIAYVKEVTPQFSVMDIYSDKKSEVNQALTEYLNEKLTEEYGINVVSALIIDVQLDETLQEKIKAKEQAKQDAEIAELDRQTAIARAETDKTIAAAEAEVLIIQAEAEAEMVIIRAEAEAEANRIIAESITPELISMMEAEARKEHGWVTVNGAGSVVTDTRG